MKSGYDKYLLQLLEQDFSGWQPQFKSDSEHVDYSGAVT